MKLNSAIYKLTGCVQNYAWGGTDFIPNLLNIENADKKPCAEYWMGAHPRASATITVTSGETVSLFDVIKAEPAQTIGEKVFERFGELPYLFKVLDVNEMLSIQVHPSKTEAIKGFEAEEAAGIPIDAQHRNYKDKNHKPEVMIALGEFYLLHGFKNKTLLGQTLHDVPEFEGLQKIFKTEGYFGLYKMVMEMPQLQSDAILKPLIMREMRLPQDPRLPGYWVKKMYNNQVPAKNFDKGIFSIYFFNIVCLQKGEGIFQGAGVPHAYLQGQNVELMANSDNVLRGGLTPKHIDVPELLKHTIFESIEPDVIYGAQSMHAGEKIFAFPVDDFAISSIRLQANETYKSTSYSAEIILVLEGQVEIDGQIFNNGETIFIVSDTSYSIQASAKSQLYKAFAPEV